MRVPLKIDSARAIQPTNSTKTTIGEILDKAFSQTQAVLILMTPDDESHLRESFWKLEDPSYETELTPQARLNVLFEAGIAMALG